MTCIVKRKQLLWLHDVERVNKTENRSMLLHIKSHFQDILAKWVKISGKLQISGQFQDTFEISGISGQLGPLYLFAYWPNHTQLIQLRSSPQKSISRLETGAAEGQQNQNISTTTAAAWDFA